MSAPPARFAQVDSFWAKPEGTMAKAGTEGRMQQNAKKQQ
jgi:hypothetical protein